MSNFYSDTLSSVASSTSQQEPILGREQEMSQNYAGGFVFTLNDWDYLDRFLILGSEQNSYYTSAKQLTVKAATKVLELIQQDPIRVVNRIVEISDAGRAPKNDSAIFALALVAIYANQEGREAAYQNLRNVCRIGTHLFQFVETLNKLGKWNALAKRGISDWYNSQYLDRLTYQMLKYQNRNGWRHRDVLRLAHVKPDGLERSSVYGWFAESKPQLGKILALPEILLSYEELHKSGSLQLALTGIERYNFSWEMLPTNLLKEPQIWEVLIPKLGYTALIRNLGRMCSIGLGKPLSSSAKQIVQRLQDVELIKSSRIHPISVLSAYKTYSTGRGDKGSLAWDVNSQIKDALNFAFYEAFKNVEPTGKNFLIGVDCSGSMWGANVVGLNNITAAEAAAVMALAIAKTEQNYLIVGFDTSVSPLNISPNQTLEQVLTVMRKFKWRGTDCSQPMLYATKHKLDVDCFITITDNETWAGRIHPTQALEQYRKAMNKPNAKNVVCGTSTTNFTIADPKDPRQMDIAGFDSAVPQLISDFVR